VVTRTEILLEQGGTRPTCQRQQPLETNQLRSTITDFFLDMFHFLSFNTFEAAPKYLALRMYPIGTLNVPAALASERSRVISGPSGPIRGLCVESSESVPKNCKTFGGHKQAPAISDESAKGWSGSVSTRGPERFWAATCSRGCAPCWQATRNGRSPSRRSVTLRGRLGCRQAAAKAKPIVDHQVRND